MLSVGLGWESGANAVDIAYMLGIVDDRDISTNVNPAYAGNYDISSHIVGLSYTRAL